ncbi:26s proteasome non-atpase regulatory subunit rpn12a-like [Nannochloropsis oceanica]
MALQQGITMAKKLQSAVDNDQLAEASAILGELKVLLTGFDSLPPMNQPSPHAPEERALGRQVLEQAVFLALKQQDKTAFQRQMAQLKPYYQDAAGLGLPESTLRMPILGLNLLFLLVENRLAEFHSELEHLTEAERASTYVSFPILVEQQLMVGSYHKVLESRTHTPHPGYAFFMSLLVDTVRDAVADCSETAYVQLSVAAAKDIMLLDSDAALAEYAATKHPDWKVGGDGFVHFGKDHGPKQSKAADVPSLRLIAETLSYATELERIV